MSSRGGAGAPVTSASGPDSGGAEEQSFEGTPGAPFDNLPKIRPACNLPFVPTRRFKAKSEGTIGGSRRTGAPSEDEQSLRRRVCGLGISRRRLHQVYCPHKPRSKSAAAPLRASEKRLLQKMKFSAFGSLCSVRVSERNTGPSQRR